MIPINLQGKTALVTGASQGLGKTTATMLHQAGANVVVNYFPDEKGFNAKNAEALCAELGDHTLPFPADVCNPDHVEKMFAAASHSFGNVNCVVNNAAVIRDRSMKKISQEEWQSVIDVNLTGVFNICKAATQHMADGGRIVNFSSISGVVGWFGQCNYAAAKAGVIGLTKVLSKELARRAITVNALAPGVVLTEMGKTIPEEVLNQMLPQIPLGRFGNPEEIAGVVLFLCSDLASYVTGQTIHVNGGWWG